MRLIKNSKRSHAERVTKNRCVRRHKYFICACARITCTWEIEKMDVEHVEGKITAINVGISVQNPQHRVADALFVNHGEPGVLCKFIAFRWLYAGSALIVTNDSRTSKEVALTDFFSAARTGVLTADPGWTCESGSVLFLPRRGDEFDDRMAGRLDEYALLGVLDAFVTPELQPFMSWVQFVSADLP